MCCLFPEWVEWGTFLALWWSCSAAVCRGPTRRTRTSRKNWLYCIVGREGRGPPTAAGSGERSLAKYSSPSHLQGVSTWGILIKHEFWFHRCRARLRRLHFLHTPRWCLALAGQWNSFWVAKENTVQRRPLIIEYPGKKNSCQSKGYGRLFAQVVEDSTGSRSRW